MAERKPAEERVAEPQPEAPVPMRQPVGSWEAEEVEAMPAEPEAEPEGSSPQDPGEKLAEMQDALLALREEISRVSNPPQRAACQAAYGRASAALKGLRGS